MPDLIDEFGDPERDNRSRATARLSHQMPVIAVIYFVFSVTNYFVQLPLWLATGLGLGMCVVILIGMLHRAIARICLRCMEDVPADAPVRAQRRRGMLWWYHQTATLSYMIFYVALVFGVIALRIWLFPDPPEGLVRGGSWLNAPGDVLFLAFVMAIAVHHKLSPWCPYCKPWDEGGPHERTPNPDPVNVKTA